MIVAHGLPSSTPRQSTSARAVQGPHGSKKTVRSAPLLGGASETLRLKKGAIFMSLSNLIHRLEYTERDDSIRIQQYTRRLTYSTKPIKYECVVWPSLASDFQKVEATFRFPVSTERHVWP